MKKTLLVSVLLIPLMLIAIPIGYAGNPGPPGLGEKFVGPAVVGTITITPGGDLEGVIAKFTAHCRGIPFTIGPYSFGSAFDAVTPEFLEGHTVGYAGTQIPLDCAPSKGGYDTEARIFNVTQFDKIDGMMITAHVVVLFVVRK